MRDRVQKGGQVQIIRDERAQEEEKSSGRSRRCCCDAGIEAMSSSLNMASRVHLAKVTCGQASLLSPSHLGSPSPLYHTPHLHRVFPLVRLSSQRPNCRPSRPVQHTLLEVAPEVGMGGKGREGSGGEGHTDWKTG